MNYSTTNSSGPRGGAFSAISCPARWGICHFLRAIKTNPHLYPGLGWVGVYFDWWIMHTTEAVVIKPLNWNCKYHCHFHSVGLRIYDDSTKSTDQSEARALSHKKNLIDIYSNSWGPGGLGTWVGKWRDLAHYWQRFWKREHDWYVSLSSKHYLACFRNNYQETVWCRSLVIWLNVSMVTMFQKVLIKIKWDIVLSKDLWLNYKYLWLYDIYSCKCNYLDLPQVDLMSRATKSRGRARAT